MINVRRNVVMTGLLLCQLLVVPAIAGDVVSVKLMTLELARDIAQGAIDACRKDGYQVSVVVVDRSGRTQVLMRDIFANQYLTSWRWARRMPSYFPVPVPVPCGKIAQILPMN